MLADAATQALDFRNELLARHAFEIVVHISPSDPLGEPDGGVRAGLDHRG
jgi:hypothetical protein